MDIILGDPTFTFPLDKVNYTDRDIIIWGGKKQILAGDAEYGAPQLCAASWVRPRDALAGASTQQASGGRCRCPGSASCVVNAGGRLAWHR